MADHTNQNYTAFQPRISGYVTDGAGIAMPGVTVSANNSGTTAVTDANGYYQVTVFYGWSGKVTPSPTAWGFDPASRSYNNVIADQTNQDYTAFQPTISGQVWDRTASVMAGVTVSADNGGTSDTTDAGG
ncbi:MAG: carboxypeptidase-like regulatory domain-containing protein, partial [Planctomycetota bacterium]